MHVNQLEKGAVASRRNNSFIDNLKAFNSEGESTHVDVTVCVITYNHVAFIRDALDGILKQRTTCSWNVLVFDDRSTDGTTEIVQAYERRFPDRIRLVVQEKNVGALENWKQLLLSADGRYIAYIEGDDYWISQDKIEKQLNILNNKPDVGIVYSQAKQERRNGSKPVVIGRRATRNDLIRENPIPSSTVMFRNINLSDFFSELDEQLKCWKMSDWPLWLWITQRGEIDFLPETTAVYNINHNSTTHITQKVKWIQSKISIIKYFKGVPKNRSLSGVRLRLVALYAELLIAPILEWIRVVRLR